jgi:hypothetical protein
VNAEYVCPDLFGDVVALVPAGNDKRLAERQLARASGFFIPRLYEQFLYARFEFIKLLASQA